MTSPSVPDAPAAPADSLRLRYGVLLIALAILVVELAMVRVMDVVLAPNTGYMVLTSAMFALGLGGIALYLFRLGGSEGDRIPWRLSVAFALATLAILPVFNLLPFDADFTGTRLRVQVLAWAAMYLTLIVPFLIGGVILSYLFTVYSSAFHRLYLFDLVGAGAACLLFIPLLPYYGPEGLLWVAAAFALAAAACFNTRGAVAPAMLALVALVAAVYPLTRDTYLEFRGHANKRNNDVMIAKGQREHMAWDPVSKLDVMKIGERVKLFSLDGGQQGSWLGRFDGNFETLRRRIRDEPGRYYYGRNSLVHHLYRERAPEVLVIGSAAGGEVRVALAVGAARVDAVELVGAMVRVIQNRYDEFAGGIYRHPQVNAIVGEGRTFLRSTDRKYDIIQMFSNHTSSTIASGAGAAGVAYLQTVDAYLEYFEHLKPDGALQINHHIYPRMLTTAAAAWHRMGRRDFWRHVVVLEDQSADTLATVIIKMQPWTEAQVTELLEYAYREKAMPAVRPAAKFPSAKIHAGLPFRTALPAGNDEISGIRFRVGTYSRNGLPFDLHVRLMDDQGRLLRETRVAGADVKDNADVTAGFEPLTGVRNTRLRVEIAVERVTEQDGFSVWHDVYGQPLLSTLPPAKPASYRMAFDPLHPDHNLVPAKLLDAPFPTALAERLPWHIEPVTDDSPYFGMIRKFNRPMLQSADSVVDANTAYLLNERLGMGVPKDWFHLFAVAVVSVAFALVFLLVPFFVTRRRQANWRGMNHDIVYFACLGLGFILIEVAFIQLFTKLIGFPTHAFVAVVFTMLVSAGIGSGVSMRLTGSGPHRWRMVFLGIIAYGLVFAAFYRTVFDASLGLPLSGRLAVAVALIAPFGFLLGMPFPLGVERLSRRSGEAVAWAWAVNGFFTVVGGYLTILISIKYGFTVALYLAVAIYGLAYLMHRHVRGIAPAAVPVPTG